MIEVIVDAVGYVSENYPENATVIWLSIMSVAIVISIIATRKFTIFFYRLETNRVKPLKDKNEELERQLATCREKVRELHSKIAELLAKHYSEDNEGDEHPAP